MENTMSKVTSYEEVSRYEKDYAKIPIKKEIYGDDITPIGLIKQLEGKKKRFYLFESMEDKGNSGRYSYIGYSPIRQISATREGVLIENLKEGTKKVLDSKSPIVELTSILKESSMPKVSGFPMLSGGFVGYFSYEFFGLIEKKVYVEESDYPYYDLMEYEQVIVFDHLKQKIILVATYDSREGRKGYEKAIQDITLLQGFIKGEEEYEQASDNKEQDEGYDAELRSKEIKEIGENVITTSKGFRCNVSKEVFHKQVEKIRGHIKEGDIFQAVISRRFDMEYDKSLFYPYRVMRRNNPSPYMYYINTPTIEIAGTSPETLVKLEDNTLTTYPVAGTRPRGKTIEEDIQLEKELLQDEKELSEHNMLVDLARNDIGKISSYGTVTVPEYKKIHRFSKVMHIASTVKGELKDGYTSVDAISSILPAGTLSGAPKIRAVEIIAKIEKEVRGVYGGGIGYLSYTGDMDICIGIRTAVKKGGRVSVQAGCGVVLDSNWESEYEECGNKAVAIMNAFSMVEEVEA